MSAVVESKDVRVIVFDFGGVIAKADTAQMANFLMQKFNLHPEELSNAIDKMHCEVLKEKTEKQFWEQFALSRHVVLPEDWFGEFGRVIEKSIQEIPGMIPLIQALKSQGYQTAMLSDATQYQTEIIRKMGYYDLFHPILLSCETGFRKPHPEAFKNLLNVLKQPACSLLFIDDRIENVKAAKSQGIDAIHFVGVKELEIELEKRGVRLN